MSLTEDMTAYLACKDFLSTPAAIALKKKLEAQTGEPAVKETGLDVWVHPELAKLMAQWMDSPDLIKWTQENL